MEIRSANTMTHNTTISQSCRIRVINIFITFLKVSNSDFCSLILKFTLILLLLLLLLLLIERSLDSDGDFVEFLFLRVLELLDSPPTFKVVEWTLSKKLGRGIFLDEELGNGPAVKISIITK